MKIVVAKTAGFCMGVRRAVDMVLDASNLSDDPIYTYGPLIHNPQVLQMLEEKNIFKIEKIPEKGSGIVLVRAHGVPPEDEKALKDAGFTLINATCPRVVRVQVIINKFSQKGYATIIIGDEKHPEVIGLLGYAKGNGHTITSMKQLAALPRFENAVVVAQTTQNTTFYEEIKAWCEIHAPHYKIFDTICGSTERRQTEIRELAESTDAVIVVGGKQSGNTKRLAQIASQSGKPTTHIEEVSDIDYKILSAASSVTITAGASTPNWIINEACQTIENNLQSRHKFKLFLLLIRDFLLKTNLLAATGAGFLTYACSIIQGIAKSYHHALIAMLYVLSMQILNNLFIIKSDKYNHPLRALFYQKNRLSLWIMAVLSGATGLYLSFKTGIVPFIVLLFMSLLGLSYTLKIYPAIFTKKGFVRIKDIPGSKTILITLAWGTVTSLLPAMANQSGLLSTAAVFLFSAGLVFSRTAYFDILALQGDRITGKETLPILIGVRQSFKLIKYVLTFGIYIFVVAFFTDLLVMNAFFLAIIPFLMLLLIKFFEKDNLVSNTHREFIIEFLFITAGLLAVMI